MAVGAELRVVGGGRVGGARSGCKGGVETRNPLSGGSFRTVHFGVRKLFEENSLISRFK